MQKRPIRVALVHDWLTGMRGGEHVLEAIAELFPRAELFTLIYIPGTVSPMLTVLKRRTSILQKFPNIEKRYRNFLPLMPKIMESFDLSGFDLIISSSHCVAKGIKKPKDAVHVSYIHAPMRYMWDRYDDYFGAGRSSIPVRTAARSMRSYLRNWDKKVTTSDRVDYLMTNSKYIASQVRTHYDREAQVIYPFVRLENFTQKRRPGSNYLMVTAFAPYKRVDLAIEAFNKLKLPLLIIGSGQDRDKLKKLAGPTIDFLGQLSDQSIADLYAKCKAFIFPGKEDFGITPLEAMASGAPVIALGEGGASETVTSKTGVLFKPQTVEALIEAIMKVEKGESLFFEQDCRNRAAEFTRERFQHEFVQGVKTAWVQAGRDLEDLESKLESESWTKRRDPIASPSLSVHSDV
jgi:glycosyltransferase involved in cell wall biosynthesis